MCICMYMIMVVAIGVDSRGEQPGHMGMVAQW